MFSPVRNTHFLLRWLEASAKPMLCILLTCLPWTPGWALVNLADQPLFSSTSVPGNLVLPLSVEYPTAVSVAHKDATYASASTYLGYFDPNKCYTYQQVDVESASAKSHFYPSGTATSHTCIGTNDDQWSGNFMNWATMQTIDPFRWAMTGGYRVVDTPSLTILEKAWASGQGGSGNFPDRTITDSNLLINATPFKGAGTWTSVIQGKGEKMLMSSIEGVGSVAGGMLGTYFNNASLSGTAVLTRYENVNFDWGLGSPAPGIVNVDNFSARWVSSQTAPSTGFYSFQTYSDDGMRLWVNGVLVIDNWTDHALTINTSSDIYLKQGDPLNIRLEYYEKGGFATMQLRWKTPGAFLYSTYSLGDYLKLPVRVKVCDPSASAGGVEANCKAYGSNYKPEGLMQQYSNRIRYGVFGYLNDSNLLRDGGVLRAKQKFIGPTYPVPGSADATNAAQEWDSATGVYVTNPDTTDAASTSDTFKITITNSGVLNYLNKFGSINKGNYKGYDPVSELYYAALRYYKKQGNVKAWTDMSGADLNTKTAWADGFPVITDWNDPILYSCQRNFILGIGDTNTHADKNVPGPTATANEPPKPQEVIDDKTVDAVAATNKVGQLQGLGNNLGTTNPYNGCCNNNSALMAGLAYDANTTDIRADLPNPSGAIGQTVQTYWVDVLETGYAMNNQYYLAAKYGGFKVPAGFSPYANTTVALLDSWWHTNTDTVSSWWDSQPRPDNYFVAGRPDQMVSGLTQAFAKINSDNAAAFSTSSATASPNVRTGDVSYSATYTPGTWNGNVTASTVSYDSAGVASYAVNWNASDLLDAKSVSTRKIITYCDATSAGIVFQSLDLTKCNSAGRTNHGSFANVGGVAPGSQSASNYLDYLRGVRTQETSNGGPYRARAHLLADIVNAKVNPVGRPSAPYRDGDNPGYSNFKKTYANRTTVVYAGSNDGMMHAFDGSVSSSTGGSELFAYIPSFVYGSNATAPSSGLASLGNPSFIHHYLVDATPRNFDVDFNRAGTPGTSATASDWHSILIGGLGKGGKGYYAIDVTDPTAWTSEGALAQKVLWEFPANTDSMATARMGYSYGDPTVVKTAKHGWVVIFSSGYNNADGVGYFFIVNPKTGALLETVSTLEGSVSAPLNMAQHAAYIPDAGSYTADAVYAGDLQGNVWRLDLTTTSGNYSSPTKIAQLYKVKGVPQPVTTAPLIDSNPSSKKRYVMLGTGQLLSENDISSTATQSFYAISDGTSSSGGFYATAPTGYSFPLTRENGPGGVPQLVANTNLVNGIGSSPSSAMGWYLDLSADSVTGIAERINIPADSNSGIVAFAANLPNGQACTPSGTSRYFAINFANGTSVLKDKNGVIIQSYMNSNGVATEVRIRSVNGRLRLNIGDTSGATLTPDGDFSLPLGLTKLNWREVPDQE